MSSLNHPPADPQEARQNQASGIRYDLGVEPEQEDQNQNPPRRTGAGKIEPRERAFARHLCSATSIDGIVIFRKVKDRGCYPEGMSVNHDALCVALDGSDRQWIVSTAQTDSTPYAGLADPARHLYGIQFHPEVTHTRQGGRILERFLFEICGC